MSDADKYTPQVESENVEVGVKIDLTDNITNSPDLPEGTIVKDVTPEGSIDTNKPGNYEGIIEIEYPDGSKETIKVPVEVVDTEAPLAPEVNQSRDGDITISGKTEPNADVIIKLPDGSEYHGKADEKGNFEVKVPKLEANDKITVISKDKLGNISDSIEKIVKGKQGTGSLGDSEGTGNSANKVVHHLVKEMKECY